jgi:hypothetical protein
LPLSQALSRLTKIHLERLRMQVSARWKQWCTVRSVQLGSGERAPEKSE